MNMYVHQIRQTRMHVWAHKNFVRLFCHFLIFDICHTILETRRYNFSKEKFKQNGIPICKIVCLSLTDSEIQKNPNNNLKTRRADP